MAGLTRANFRPLQGNDPSFRPSFHRVLSAPIRCYADSRGQSGKCQGQGLEKRSKEGKGERCTFENDVRS